MHYMPNSDKISDLIQAIKPITRRQNFRLVQIETNSKLHFKVPCSVENIVRKGEIDCYKQFLLFSRCFSKAIYL